MPLLGAGVLAIWNGIAPEAEDAFVAWHVREHIPERVGLPGFLRGRRYVALEGAPKYFNFYETDGPDALTSAAYLARLNAPTPWTREVVAQFRDTSRTICDVVLSLGEGEGGTIGTIQFSPASASPGESDLRQLAAAPGIVGVHLLRGRPSDSAGGTVEKTLRAQPDHIADGILLIESVDAASVKAASAGLALGGVRGVYQLQFGLTKKEGMPLDIAGMGVQEQRVS